jgi:hypothetical protein
MPKSSKGRSHLVIPDTQVKPGVPIDHIIASAHYAVRKKPNVIIMIGDWWDMASLSMYEKKGSKYFHGKSYVADIDAGNTAMRMFMGIIEEEKDKVKRNKKKSWNPRMIFTMGNHEARIERAAHNDPALEGLISYDDLFLEGWEVFPYQVPVVVDGIAYCHNFVNPDSLTKNILGGAIENRLSKIKHSFTMGHQQKRLFGQSYNALGQELMGLVVGRFYQHEEKYMGPQGQADWSGIVMKHDVEEGSYDPMFIRDKWLIKRYAGDSLGFCV